MKTEQVFESYARVAGEWIEAAEKQYSDEAFRIQPGGGIWSLAQVYEHLVLVTEKCLDNALSCADGKGESGHLAIGPAIFMMMGSFPPVELKIRRIPPGLEAIYEPKGISRSEAVHRLKDSINKMRSALPFVSGASPRQRMKHWVGGWFNGGQWYRCAEMHLRHHLRQKKKIDRCIDNAKKPVHRM